MQVVNGTSLSSLTPTIDLSAGATVSPNSGAAQDFSDGAVIYTVTAEDGSTTQAWDVTVTEADPVAAGTIFEFALADEAEVDAFIAAMPGNGFVGVNTEKNSFGGTFGIKILANGSLTYDAVGLAAGAYRMEVDVMVQNPAVLPWIQDGWLTSDPIPTIPSPPSEGTANTFVTLTKTVNLAAGNNTFGILRGGSGAQLFVKAWKVDFLPPLSVEKDVIKNNFTISKTGVSLNDISGNVQIIDLLGRVLISKQLRAQETLDYKFKSTTIYMVRLTTELGSATKKVVF